MVLALVLSVAAGIGFVVFTDKFNESVRIPVAVKDIPPYTKITADMYKMEDMPKAAVPADAARTGKEIDGKYTRETVYAGEPVRQARLGQVAGQGAVLAAKVTALGDPNLRAYALPYTPESAVGGKILPGDRIDIIASVKMESAQGAVGFGKVIGANVLVLDVSLPSQGSRGCLTVALTPAQIEDIAFALSSGTISFALNGYNTNVQAAATLGVTGQDWLVRHGYGTAPAPGK